jgi:hypothetical protein
VFIAEQIGEIHSLLWEGIADLRGRAISVNLASMKEEVTEETQCTCL